jgi:hypothetical protein
MEFAHFRGCWLLYLLVFRLMDLEIQDVGYGSALLASGMNICSSPDVRCSIHSCSRERGFDS